ncbi:ABC transporter substrate-binding protein [Ahrensia sp. R2A130]|uniref:ABC transporter substrate-binding protein n=1 Tax=Ahrensia sp. R2A130 TaxID=744979 RepID=UPI00058D59BA|nr:ABC transporter substrate-binding protein [Ahrensia sp. R2A130]
MKKLIAASLLALAVSTPALADGHGNMKFAPGEGAFNWASYDAYKAAAPKLEGEALSIFGPWTGAEKDNFNELIKYFNAATGANATYAGSDSFEQQIVIDAEAGSAPNISAFPQPGLAANLAAKGQLVPLADDVEAYVNDEFAAGPSWTALGTYKDASGNDDFYAIPFNVNVKSLVWYIPENFEDAGYEIPSTMEELKALSDKIVADGETPWCIGLGSGAATGWPATDWVEDLLLRTQSPDVYDQWVKNEIGFDDPRIVAAIDEFGAFARNDKYVDGGAGAVATTDFRDSPKGMFASPPKCYMHRQASFIPAFFPEGTKLGQDADFFYFPAFAEKDLGTPVLGAGILLAMTKESPAARAFMQFLKTPIASEIMMAQGAFLTPSKSANAATYPDDSTRKQGEILTNATTFRFDGSDLMPGKIGAGAFWTGMVDYAGGKPAAEVAAGIQKEWDAIK